MNLLGMWWLFRKETLRFLKVTMQTIIAPLIMSLLYLLVFGSVLEDAIITYDSVKYSVFLVPGLAMMAIMQNSFSNPSSSIIQSKMSGNIVFMLLAPLSYFEIFLAYLASAVFRGILVGLLTLLASMLLVNVEIYSWIFIVIFAFLSAIVLSIFGIIAGIVSDKYEGIAAFQNFLIMPLTFLSGVFYSIGSLSELWQSISIFNPMLYMIDGFRFGFLGQSDIPVLDSLIVLLSFVLLSSIICLAMLKSGYRIRD